MEYATPYDSASSQCSREASYVRFMYFSPTEVRNMSVHEINDPVTFDEWGVPLDGGLHAQPMGPLHDFGKYTTKICKTCGLDRDCPGHMGHIELSSTIYNPFLLQPLLKLLKQTCMHCHRFKTQQAVSEALVNQLERLAPDEMAKLRSTDPLAPSSSSGANKRSAWLSDIGRVDAGRFLIEDLTQGDDALGFTVERQAAKDAKVVQEEATELAASFQEAATKQESIMLSRAVHHHDSGPTVQACTQSLRAVIAQFAKELPTVCPHCKGNAKWRKEGHHALFVKPPKGTKEYACLPEYVRNILRELWKNESALLRWVCPMAKEVGPDVFFMDRILVPPNRFRPPKTGEGSVPSLDRQTMHLKGILMANKEVARSLGKVEVSGYAPPKLELSQAVENLQISVNSFMDKMKSGKHQTVSTDGIRQLLEKKEGLFRMKMMGKRVNFAARSVISPDPNIETSEIGVPQAIASQLYYPEVATPHNVHQLRKLVERGAALYPGADEVHIPNANGSKNIKALAALSPADRKTLGRQLITDVTSGKPPWTVFRHLRDGDPVLVNRQPTLHKPGIMAHTVKVLRKEHTIRLHYVNCNTYNADFDGDEMNLHAPQDPISRMEALAIARADRQYLVPTCGKPLRGLIQDHVIAGSFITKRDTFYTKDQVCLLLYAGLRAALEGQLSRDDEVRLNPAKPMKGSGKGVKEEDVISTDPWEDRPWHKPNVKIFAQKMKLELEPPCVFKPQRLWSGKQVMSMVLKHLIKISQKGKIGEKDQVKNGICMDGKSKTPGDIWNGKLDGCKEEATVMFRGTDLLMGVLDKNSFGAVGFGITHMCFELMGGHFVSMWLATIARLFSLMLQLRGFTCRYEDLVLRDEIDDQRRRLIMISRKNAKATAEAWLQKHGQGGQLPTDKPATPQQVSSAARSLFHQKAAVEHYEGMTIGKMKESWSCMINECIPIGQKIPVPKNNFASMVQTGAKGSTVNQSQVCACLGQQELEGRLPPLMATQRSLPCFAPNDLSNRTRGYISDRFLTGIRPQEFFFHCMAGREGLVDTAVKTSRSGYLQRCLVKHLESLKVSYDHSVRDADGSVIQFLYGEDGADVIRSPYLYKFDELRANFHFMRELTKHQIAQMRQGGGKNVDLDSAEAYLAALEAAKAGEFATAIQGIQGILDGSELDKAATLSLTMLKRRLKEAKKAKATSGAHLFDPVASVLGPAHYYGSTSERHEQALQEYVAKAIANNDLTEKQAVQFTRSMRLKFLKALTEPGEAVGVLAAQSMGEPSTQMTLNTFHLAGHGGANVTLGIPRLREIIQTASRSCSTPLMTIPVLGMGSNGKPVGVAQRMAAAQALKRKFRKVTLMDCLSRVAVSESVQLVHGKAVWIYHCRLEFMNLDELCKAVPHVSLERIEAFMVTICRKLKLELARVVKESKDAAKATSVKRRGTVAAAGGAEDGGGAADKDEEGDEEKKPSGKKKQRKARGAVEDKEAAKEAAADDEDVEEDDDASSGMYSSDNEDPKILDEPDEAELGGADTAEGRMQEDSETEDEAELKKDKLGKDDDSDDSELEDEKKVFGEVSDDEEDEPKKGKKIGKGDRIDDPDDEDAEDAEDEGKAGKRKAAAAKLGETKLAASPKKKKSEKSGAAAAAGKAKMEDSDEARFRAQAALKEALNSGQFVWSSSLVNNAMSIIVTHSHSQCPHSLFVGNVLHGICKNAELQDPSCQGVNAVHVKEDKDNISLECEGINLFGLQALPPNMVDHNKIYTNNIRNILETFGCEAARAAVVREVKNVFGHYGIEVDHRHLSLIADYMAQGGDLRAFNRLGMLHSPSPLLQMSYETTMQFLGSACQEDLLDTMKSPAASIVLGQPPLVGTGMVNLLMDLDPPDPPWKKHRKFTF